MLRPGTVVLCYMAGLVCIWLCRKWRSSFFNFFYFCINIGSLVGAGTGKEPDTGTRAPLGAFSKRS